MLTHIPEPVFILSQCSIIFTLVTQLLMTGEFNSNLLYILIEELERTLKWKSLPHFDSKKPNVLISDVCSPQTIHEHPTSPSAWDRVPPGGRWSARWKTKPPDEMAHLPERQFPQGRKYNIVY